MPSRCYWSICFIHLPTNGVKFFGFAEYLAAVALIALAWTMADFRYKFRVATAPIPLQMTTFVVVASVGVLTLLTDLWRTEGWLVPEGPFTPGEWQALLGAAFLFNFIVWIGFAFALPSRFGRLNDERFGFQVYKVILRGIPAELSEAADELIRSFERLIRYAWTEPEIDGVPNGSGKTHADINGLFRTRQCAHEILLMLGDKRFCRQVVSSSPPTALVLFDEMERQNKHSVSLGTFAKNITTEAIANRDSFAYHETSGYEAGLLGHVKPLTSALYGNYKLVSALKQVYDVHYEQYGRWDAAQWKAFSRLLLTTTKNFVAVRGAPGAWYYPPEISRAVDLIQNSADGLSMLNGKPEVAWSSDDFKKLQVAADFANAFIEALGPMKGKGYQTLRKREGKFSADVYDIAANLIFHLVFIAASIKTPETLSWSVQHNVVWSTFFDMADTSEPSTKVVQFKVRRLLYNELKRMDTFPNFKGTRLLGLLLNVMGLSDQAPSKYDRNSRPLKRATLSWTRKNFARIWEENNRAVGENALVDGITYDADKACLIHTQPPMLGKETRLTVFQVNPYVSPQGTPNLAAKTALPGPTTREC